MLFTGSTIPRHVPPFLMACGVDGASLMVLAFDHGVAPPDGALVPYLGLGLLHLNL